MTIKEFIRVAKREKLKLKRKLFDFHRDAAIIARDERKKGFMRSESPTGEKWPKLSPKTIKRKKGEHSTTRVYRKKKNGPSGLSERGARASKSPEKPLIDTGAMMTPTVEANHIQGKVIMARSRGEVVSTAGSIAKIHQDGAGHNPRREHWGIYPLANRRIDEAWEALLDGLVKAISGR